MYRFVIGFIILIVIIIIIIVSYKQICWNIFGGQIEVGRTCLRAETRLPRDSHRGKGIHSQTAPKAMAYKSLAIYSFSSAVLWSIDTGVVWFPSVMVVFGVLALAALAALSADVPCGD